MIYILKLVVDTPIKEPTSKVELWNHSDCWAPEPSSWKLSIITSFGKAEIVPSGQIALPNPDP